MQLLRLWFTHALALRTRTSASRIFNLKFLLVLSKRDTPESFILLFFTKRESTVIYA